VSRLPRGLSYRRVVAALKAAGFSVRRRKGSHIVLRRDEPFAQVVVTAHRSIDTGTLANIPAGAGLTSDEFLNLLQCTSAQRRPSLPMRCIGPCPRLPREWTRHAPLTCSVSPAMTAPEYRRAANGSLEQERRQHARAEHRKNNSTPSACHVSVSLPALRGQAATSPAPPIPG